MVLKTGRQSHPTPVSYTHLDVYKRQVRDVCHRTQPGHAAHRGIQLRKSTDRPTDALSLIHISVPSTVCATRVALCYDEVGSDINACLLYTS